MSNNTKYLPEMSSKRRSNSQRNISRRNNSQINNSQRNNSHTRNSRSNQIIRNSRSNQILRNLRSNQILRNSRSNQILFSLRSNSKDSTRILQYLTQICSNAGECLAIGNENDVIRQFFNGFVDFKYIELPIEKFGVIHQNAFIYKLKYTRQAYSCYSILKSSLTQFSDNLAYEYMVGQFINKQCKRFPCFVETYGLFYYNSEDSWNEMNNNNNKNFSKKKFKKMLKLRKTSNFNYRVDADSNTISKLSCQKSKYASLLIQYIPNAITLYEMIVKVNTPVNYKTIKSRTRIEVIPQYDDSFVQYHLHYILFQIYFALTTLSEEYTHYDLHLNNVLLYELEGPSYLEYRFHFKDGSQIYFKSKYVVKIIDYSKSFFYNTEMNNSLNIYNIVCRECNKCGLKQGFQWFGKLKESNRLGYINSSENNQSHDLLLLNRLYGYATETRYIKINENEEIKKIEDDGNTMFTNMPDKLQSLLQNVVYEGDGTPYHESKKDFLLRFASKEKVYNIHDTIPYLVSSIENNREENENLYGIYKSEDNINILYTSIGTLDIYEYYMDMKFTPAI